MVYLFYLPNGTHFSFIADDVFLKKKRIVFSTGASTLTCFLHNNTLVQNILCVDFSARVFQTTTRGVVPNLLIVDRTHSASHLKSIAGSSVKIKTLHCSNNALYSTVRLPYITFYVNKKYHRPPSKIKKIYITT